MSDGQLFLLVVVAISNLSISIKTDRMKEDLEEKTKEIEDLKDKLED